MPEAATTLKQKTGELETAIDETRRELAQVEAERRTEAHHELVAICKQATEWLEQCAEGPQPASDEDTASRTQRAETFLRELRMKRSAI